MSAEKVCLDYLVDMLESAKKALEFVEGMGYEEFASERSLRS